MCLQLTAPVNGQIAYSTDQTPDFDFGTVVTYTCDRGYGLNDGDSERMCGGDGGTSNGMWSGISPSCECKEKILIFLFNTSEYCCKFSTVSSLICPP